MKWFIGAIVAIGIFSTVIPATTHALGLKVAPLEYKTELKKNETKQGFIDISNPSGQSVDVTISVQAFKQINDDGGLQFYDDQRVQRGITPDVRRLELKAREAYRIFFKADGRRLPQGDVYAGIFFTTQPKQSKNGVGQLVRVGTLLSITNQTPGERKAEITGLTVPFIQFKNDIEGSYTIRNIGKPERGFYPSVKISEWPGGGSKNVSSSLVFGGRTRSNDFTYQSNIGIHKIRVAYGSSSREAWVLVLNPGIAIAAVLVFIVVAVELILFGRRRRAKK